MTKLGNVKQYLQREVLKSSDHNGVNNEIGGAPLILHDPSTGERIDGALGDDASGTVGHLITDLNVRTGNAINIYDSNGNLLSSINWTDIGTGGGAAGGGLESLEIANEMEKQGRPVALPNGKHIRNAYVSSNPLLCWLRESYATTAGAVINMDHGLTSELALLDACDATTGWTASAGAVTADTGTKLQGTASLKHALTTLSGTANIYKTFTAFSQVDRHAKVSCNPSDITSLTSVSVIFESSAGNNREFTFLKALLGATAWNHLTCDFDDPTKYTDTGTFVRGSITKIYFKVTTSSSMTFNVFWDFFTAISSVPLLVPSYGQSIAIVNNTNQEVLTILSEDRTDNTTKGTFTFGGPTTRLYFSGDFVSLNVINLKLNGVAMTPVTFNSTHSQTCTDLAAQILAQFTTEVLTATADATNDQIIITAKSGQTIAITDIVVTLGTSQPTGLTAASLKNAYTNDYTTTYLSTCTGTVSNNQLQHKSTASGDAAKNAKQIDTLLLQQTVDSATLEAFVRFYDKGWKVTAFPTTTELTLLTDSDDSTRLPNGQKFFLVKISRVGAKQGSPEGSHTINFKYLTATSCTYGAPSLTLNHTESNSVGADATDYWVIPESAVIDVSAEGKNGKTFTKMTPKEVLFLGMEIPAPLTLVSYYSFDNAGVDVRGVQDLAVGSSVVKVAGKFKNAYSGFVSGVNGRISSGAIQARLSAVANAFTVDTWITFPANNGATGDYLFLNWDGGAGNAYWVKIYFYATNRFFAGYAEGGGQFLEVATSAYNNSQPHHVVLDFNGNNTCYCHIDGVLIGSGTVSTAGLAQATGRISLGQYAYDSTRPWGGIIHDMALHVRASNTQIDPALIKDRYAAGLGRRYVSGINGILVKYEEAVTAVDKIEIIKTNHRENTTLQTSLIYSDGTRI